LDFGSGTLRCALAEIDNGNDIHILTTFQSPYAGYYEGEFVEPEKLQDDILNVIDNINSLSGKKIKKLFVGLPSEFCGVICRTVEKEWQKPTLVTQTIVDDLLHTSLEQMQDENLRFLHANRLAFVDEEQNEIQSPVSNSSMLLRMNVSFVYAVESICQQIETCLSNCGIEDVEFVASPLAQAQVLFSDFQRNEGVSLMDNGFSTSFVASIKGDGLAKLTSFDLGGAHITSQLMESFKLKFNEAEDLKHKIILTVNPIELNCYESDVANSFIPIPARQANRYAKLKVQQFANLARKCLKNQDFVRDENSVLYITGGGLAELKGSKDILQEDLNIEVVQIHNNLLGMDSYSLSALASVIEWGFRNRKIKKGLFGRLFKKN